jgi:hypothetical protein
MNEATLEKMLAALTPDIVTALRTAVELGKWPDGRRLTQEQYKTSMEAVIAWEHHHLPEEERTGYINKGDKQEGDVCDAPHENEQEFVKFLHQRGGAH